MKQRSTCKTRTRSSRSTSSSSKNEPLGYSHPLEGFVSFVSFGSCFVSVSPSQCTTPPLSLSFAELCALNLYRISIGLARFYYILDDRDNICSIKCVWISSLVRISVVVKLFHPSPISHPHNTHNRLTLNTRSRSPYHPSSHLLRRNPISSVVHPMVSSNLSADSLPLRVRVEDSR